MKKIFYLLLLHLCYHHTDAQINISRNLPTINLATITNTAFEKGKINIKFHRFQFNKIQISLVNQKVIFTNSTLNVISQQYQFVAIKNIFATLLQDETNIKKHQLYNLDLWFTIEFDTTKNVKNLVAALQQINFFEVVEPVYKKHLLDANKGVTFVPNDPQLSQQWHYNNTGQGLGTIGKDIKLLDAWDIETGKPQVIVALHDMGVQLNHPDLAQNILPNKSFNFVDNNTTIIGGYHGTHTAGTIAAVNNNGIGVSGIAGGNGNANSGARIMNLQIFDLRNGHFVSSGFAESFIYAADNGAAISSNSWAYDEGNIYELAVIDAIDYFIENGGGTALQGGLVIFAAGNVSRAIPYFPSSYDRVVCVAATNNRDEKTYYSTYGNWVDIAAPGGEDRGGNASQVLSTTVGSAYATDQGTSMACPHVAGVAALVASKLLGKASASDVRDILLSTTDNIDALNPNFIGLIGSGRLNAFKALQKAQALLNNTIVASVDSVKVIFNCNTINLNWKKNNNNNNVIIIYSNKNDIGIPTNGTQYNAGSSFTGTSNIIYKGNANSFSLPNNNKMLYFFKVFSIDINNNYSLGKTVEIVAPADINSSGATQQNFDYPSLFPTQEWRTIDINKDGKTWIHTAQDTAHTGAGDLYSMCMYNYSYNTLLGAVDVLTSPLINVQNADSILLNFWYAYQYRNTGLTVADSFEVLVTTDCGNTYTSLWKKTGTNLATSTSLADSAFYPFDINKWKQIKLDISSFNNTDKIQFAFRCVNGKGNNLFLDNINIDVRYKNDLAVTLVNPQLFSKCDNQLNATATIINKGNNIITSAKINYQIDGGNVITTNWSGSLKKDETAVVNIAASGLTQGNHQIKMFSSLPNNIADNFILNDTILTNFYVQETTVTFINEGFEDNKIFPNAWHTQQNDVDEIAWVKTNIGAKNSNNSIVMKNYIYNSKNKIDDLLSPVLTINKNIDSAFLVFDYAAALRKLNDSTYYDTLQIDYSKDCGNTWQNIWQKAGKQLQTIQQTVDEVFEFIPIATQWKTDSMLLPTTFKAGDNLQVRFRNINHFGNDIYLDNIQLYTKFYPQGIKEKGYAIYPNPIKNNLYIQHLDLPINLKSIELYNVLGKKIIAKNYIASAAKEIIINASNLASGIYILQLIYTDKTITEKIVKLP